MKFFANNDDLKNPLPRATAENPITYRMLHEDAAGMGLDGSFFTVSGIDPDAAVRCNCMWAGGHHETCDLVAAHALLEKQGKASR